MATSPSRLRVAIINDYQDVVRTLDCFGKLKDHEVRIFTDILEDEVALAERLADVDALVLIRERTPITRSLLQRLPNLRLISQNGHVPHIDLAACSERGVVVSSAILPKPSYSTVELTWGLIIAAMRHIPFEVRALREGRWQSTIGYGLHGRTLGIYGYGKLGAMVGAVGTAFGMKLLAWGRDGSLSRARAAGIPVATSREAFFEQSDVLTLHLRLNADTKGLIGPLDLARMKPTALLVNTSRAGLIKPGALVQALAQGRPGIAAVDVFEREPVRDGGDPLLLSPNALCTPHLGYVERDNHEFSYGNAFDQILAFAAGAPTHVQNPEALKQDAST